MFRALYENYTNPDPNVQQLQNNIIRYNDVEPNLVQTNTAAGYSFPASSSSNTPRESATIQSIMNTTTTGAFGSENFPAIEYAPNILSGPNDSLRGELNNCRTYNGINGLSNLMRNTGDINAQERCGWRYKPGLGLVSQVAQGAYGNSNGPLDPANPKQDAIGNGTKYFWNLKDAEKAMINDVCKSVTSCQDLASVPATSVNDINATCGYCTTSKKVIPILKDQFGVVRSRYTDADLQCQSQNIITADKASTRCPPPNPNDPPSNRPNCFSGPLSRDCITMASYFAGCRPEGTLGLALSQGTNQQDLASQLRNKQSFQVYQSLAQPVLNDDMLKSGNATIYAAFMNLHNVYKSMTGADPKLRAAAKDLCIANGFFEQYDFCNDLKDSDTNYEVGCMQKYFLKMGGTTQGTSYPTTKNTSRTWGQYKIYVNNLALNSRGVEGQRETFLDPMTQRNAMNEFIGLGIQAPVSGLTRSEENQGCEVFWFDRAGGETCIGRRAVPSSSGSNLPWIQVGGGEVDGTGLSDMVRFVSFCDLRPTAAESVQFGITTDDGFRLAFNQNPYAIKNSSMLFNRDYDQGPTFHTSQVFPLQSDTTEQPNILSLTWAESGGGATFTPYFIIPGKVTSWMPIVNVSTQSVNPNWQNLCYFTQEMDAPSLSFQIYTRLTQKQEYFRSVTATESWFCEKRLFFPFLQSTKDIGKIVLAADPVLPSRLPILSLSPYQIWKTQNKIAFSGFRTITFCFKLVEIPNTADRYSIFSWRSPQRFSGGSIGLSVQMSKLSDTTAKIRLQTNYEGRVGVLFESTSQEYSAPVNTWMMATITFDTESKFQRTVKRANFFVQSLEKLKRGDLFSNGGMSSVSTNGPLLFNEYKMNKNMAGFLEVGSIVTNLQVGWIHFFDRMWTGSDVELFKKEASLTWQGRWFE